jgi:hypothetical protein
MNIKELIERLEEVSAIHGDTTPVIDSNGSQIGFAVQPHPVSKIPTVVIF